MCWWGGEGVCWWEGEGVCWWEGATDLMSMSLRRSPETCGSRLGSGERGERGEREREREREGGGGV